MRTFVNAAAAAALLVSALPAAAQGSAPSVAVAPIDAVSSQVVLKTGTAIPLLAASALTSKTAKIGDAVQMKVAEDVVVAGHMVVPAGAIAIGTVTAVRQRGMLCRTGKIDAKLTTIEINGERVPLDMTLSVKGDGAIGAAGAVAGFLAFGPFAAAITGKSAVVKPGMKIEGRVAGDVALAAIGRPSPTARAAL